MANDPTNPTDRTRDEEVKNIIINIDPTKLPITVECKLDHGETDKCLDALDFQCTTGDHLGNPGDDCQLLMDQTLTG